MNPEIVGYIIQGLLGLVVFFGGMWVRDLSQAVKELRMEDQKLSERLSHADRTAHERLSNYVHKDEFREFRVEQRELFEKMFERMDAIKDSLAKKADRSP